MSRVIVNSFAWPQPGETWREFLGARTERYRREKEQLDAHVAPELRRAEHADFCYSFMRTVTEYIGSNPALLDSVIDATRLVSLFSVGLSSTYAWSTEGKRKVGLCPCLSLYLGEPWCTLTLTDTESLLTLF